MNQIFIHSADNPEWLGKLIPQLKVPYYVMQSYKEEEAIQNNSDFLDSCNLHLFVIDKSLTNHDLNFLQIQITKTLLNPKQKVVIQMFKEGVDHTYKYIFRSLVRLVREHGGIGIINEDITIIAEILNHCYTE